MRRQSISRLTIAALLLQFAGPPLLLGASLKQARVTQVVRDVKILPGQAEPKPAAVNDEITENSAVRTGAESRTELTFIDQTIARLGADTIFTFDKGTRSMDLSGGAMLLRVPKDAGGATIRTSAVTAAITGTTVLLEYNKSAFFKFIVLEGTARVALRSRPGEWMEVKAGQLFMVPLKKGVPKNLPEPVDVDLAKIMATSLLIQGFPPLGSEGLMAESVRAQQEQIAEGALASTAPVLGSDPLPNATEYLNSIDQAVAAEATPTPTPIETPTPPPPPTPAPTPQKFGPPPVITSANPYTITSGTVIQTDPTITTNGVIDEGRIFRNVSTDGALSTWLFGSTSAFDQTAGFVNGSQLGDLADQAIAFKFQNLQLNGNPTIQTAPGMPSVLELIGVDGLTSGGASATFISPGIRELLLATQNGSINLGTELFFLGMDRVFVYARGAGSSLTLGSSINTQQDIRLFSQGSLAINGFLTTMNFSSLSGGDFVGGTGFITARTFDITSLADLNFNASRFSPGTFTDVSLSLDATNSVNIDVRVSPSILATATTLSVRGGRAINFSSGNPTLIGINSVALFQAGVGGINGAGVGFLGENISLLSAGDISIYSFDSGATLAGAINAAGSFSAADNVLVSELLAGGAIDIAGLVNANNISAGTTIEVGLTLTVSGSVIAGDSLTSDSLLAEFDHRNVSGADADVSVIAGDEVNVVNGIDVDVLNAGGSIDTGANVLFSSGGATTAGHLVAFVDSSGGGTISTGGNVTLEIGGPLRLDGVLALEVDTYEGGSIGTGGNVMAHFGGDVTTTQGDMHSLNFFVVNGGNAFVGPLTGGSIGTGGNIDLTFDGDALTMPTATTGGFAAEIANDGGQIGTGGNISIAIGGNQTSSSLFVYTSNRNGGQIGTGGNIVFAVGGAVTTITDAVFEVINSGGTIGSNLAVDVHAGSFSIGGVLRADIDNRNGSIGPSGNGGSLTLRSDGAITVGQGMFVLGQVTAGGDITAGTIGSTDVTTSGAIRAGLGGIQRFTFFDGANAMPDVLHTLNATLVTSQGGIRFNGVDAVGDISTATNGGDLVINADSLSIGPDGNIVGATTFNGGTGSGVSGFEAGDGGSFTVNASGAIAVDSDIEATTGTFTDGLAFQGAGGAVSLHSDHDVVSINSRIEVSSTDRSRRSASGGNITLRSGSTDGVAINIGSSGRLLSLLDLEAPGPGGRISLLADSLAGNGSSIEINNSGGAITADRGTVDVRHLGDRGTINLINPNIGAEVIRIGALGSDGTLTLGGGTISAGTLLRLYAGGSNGSILFNGDVTLSSGAEAIIIAARQVTITNGVVVTISGMDPALVFADLANYTGFGGNGSTSGSFAGAGSILQSFGDAPGFDAPFSSNLTVVYTGAPNGNWSDPGSWIPMVVPNNSSSGRTFNASMSSGILTQNISPGVTIENFAMSGGTLSLANPLTLNAGLQFSGGTIRNGSLTIDGSSTQSALMTVSNATITNFGDYDLTIPSGNVFSGGGSVFNNFGNLTKSGPGVLSFNIPLNGGVGVLDGTLRLTSGGTLNGAFASNAGAVLELTTSYTLAEGTQIDGPGIFQLDNGITVTLVGSLNNNTGNVVFANAGSGIDLRLSGPVTLNGNGVITLNNRTNNRVFANVGGDRLTIGNGLTIQGSGNLGIGQTTFTNSGTIIANQSNPLIIQPGGGSADFTNNASGILRADGGTLQLSGVSGGVFTNQGIIEALNGSQVQLVSNASVIGGTLASTGSSIHSAGSSLTNVTNNGDFVLDNNSTTTLVGTLNNNGTLTFNNLGSGVDLRLSGSVSLTGNGVITLNDRTNNRLFANVGGDRLTIGAGQTIQGSGNLGIGQTTFTNNGTVIANQTTTLVIQPGGGTADFTNNASGILRADGGNLQLSGVSGGVFTNQGIIEALNGSQVQLVNNASVIGGTLASTGSSIHSAGSSLTNVTNNGDFVLDNSSTTTLVGTFTNNGTLTFNNAGSGVDLRLSGPVTLNGNGTITLNNRTNNRLFANFGGDRLTIGAGQTIQGSGNLGIGQTTFANSGIVRANQTNALILQAGGGTADFTNNAGGILESTSGATLQIQGGTLVNNNIVRALDGSLVELRGGVNVTGSGSFLTVGTGLISVADTATLTNLTFLGNLSLANSSTTTLVGTLTNSGTLTFNNLGSGVDLRLSGSVSLAGNGVITLNNRTNNRLFANMGGDRLTIGTGQTIQGSGNLGIGQTTFTNNGTIIANQSNTLIIQPGGGTADFTNNASGILRANGGTLQLSGVSGGVFTNQGIIEALNGSQVQLVSNASVIGGTLASTGSSIHSAGSSLTNVINNGDFVLDNSSTTTLVGTLTNNGTLTFNNLGSGVDLRLSGPVTLNGNGTITLNNRTNNRLFANTGGDRLTIGAGQTIQGSGNLGIGQTTFTNNGTIIANQSNDLTLQPGGGTADFTNNATGFLRANGVGTLVLSGANGGTFGNSGTIESTGGGTLRLNGAVTSSGVVNVRDGTLTATGSYTQTGGSFLLAGGTVQSNNALNFQAGLIDARGSVTASIMNNAMLRPALGGTGLNVTGTVSLLSQSSLVFQLGGLAQGSQYGFLGVNGTVNLGGQLVLSFVNGFQNSVAPNDSFTLLTSSNAFVGSFVNIASGNRLLTSDGAGSFMVTYSGSNLVLSNFASSMGPNVVTANWLNATSGTWTTPANWSTNPDIPNNGTPLNTVYNAVIAATGAPYTVTLATPVTVQSLTLNSNDATLSLNGGAVLQTVNTSTVSAGTLLMNAGTLRGGTLNLTGTGVLSFTDNLNNLDGILINGSFTLGVNQLARLRNGAQINGAVTLSGNNAILALDQSSVLNSALTVNLDAASSARLSVEGNNTPTLGANVIVRGAGTIGQQLLTGGTNSLTNQGTITADRSALTLNIQPNSFTNTGTLNATNGGVLNIIATTWQSSGTINATNAIVNFGGTFPSAGLGTVNGTNSVFNITGTLDNTGATYTLPVSAGAFTMSGGRILGGTLNIAPSGGSLLFTDASNRLDGVTINGNFDLGLNALARLQNGTQLNGIVNLTGNNAILALDQSSVLSSALTVNMDSASFGRLSVEGGRTPTLGANVLVRGAGQIGVAVLVGGNNALTNQGTITADRSGLGLTIQPTTFTNTGTLNATGGGILSLQATNWTSSGTINANNAVVNLGGTFPSSGIGTINGSNSTFNIVGTLDNTGATYTLPTSAVAFTMSGGRILGGTLNIAPSGGSLLFTNNSGNRLDGVTVNGNFDLGASALARLQNGTQLNGVVNLSGNNSLLALDQSSVLSSALTVNMDAASGARLSVEGGRTPTLGANVVVRGAGQIGVAALVGGNNALTNQGTITADRSGLTLAIQPTMFTNTGTLNASAGGILSLQATNWQSSGTINATNAIVNLGGTFTSAGIGTINGSNSVFNITGTLDNTAATYTLPTSAVAFTMSGGRILGGTLNIAPAGASLLFTSNSSNRLDGVTVNGTIDLDTSALARLQNGTQLNGVVNLSGNNSLLALDQSSVLSGPLTVNMDAASGARLSVEGSRSPTLGANVLVRGAGQIGVAALVGGTNGLTNQGTITADRNGFTLSIQPDSFTNSGTLNATGGGVLNIIATNWQSSGTINATNASVNFGGTFPSAGIGTLNSTNSIFNITGTLDNTAAIYTLPTSAVAFTMSGGRILGGTLNIAPSGGSLLFTNNSGNRLDGVTVNGNFDLGASALARLQNGAQLNGIANLSGNNSLLALDQSTVLSSPLTVNMDAASGARLSVEGGRTPTLGANVLVRGAGQIGIASLVGGNNGLTNQGTITADRNGLTLAIQPTTFTNIGTLNATGGGVLSLQATNWTSSGTINANNATVNLGGTFTSAGIGTINGSEGTFNIVGTLDNTGATYTLPASAGAFTMSGGRILGGTLNIPFGGASLIFTNNSANRFDAVTVNGDIELGTSEIARFQNGTQFNGDVTLSGNNSLLALDQSTVMTGELTVNMDAASGARFSVEGNNTPTLGAAVTVRGAGTIGQPALVGGTTSLTNQGTITADRSGQTLAIRPNNFNNQGVVSATDGGIINFTTAFTQTSSGRLDLSGGTISSSSALQVQAGLVTGYGNINAALINNATLRPGLANNGLNMTGNLSLLAASTLHFEIAGLTQGSQYGFVNVNGSVSLGGALAVSVLNAFSPPNSTNFTVLSSTAPLTGTFANVVSGGRLNTTDNSGNFLVSYTGNTIVLSDFQLVVAHPGSPSPSGSYAVSDITLADAGTAAAPSGLNPNSGSRPRVGLANVPLRVSVAPSRGLGINFVQNADEPGGLAPITPRRTAPRAPSIPRAGNPVAIGAKKSVAINLQNSDGLLDLLDGAQPTTAKGRVTVTARQAKRNNARTSARVDRSADGGMNRNQNRSKLERDENRETLRPPTATRMAEAIR